MTYLDEADYIDPASVENKPFWFPIILIGLIILYFTLKNI